MFIVGITPIGRIGKLGAAGVRAFTSFGILKRALGPAGAGMVWHHIVEQRLVRDFGAEVIHSTANVVAVTREVNQAIANYYSTKQAFIKGLTVRKWLEGQSSKKQFAVGLDVLQNA